MKKKVLLAISIVVCIVFCAFAFAACDDSDNTTPNERLPYAGVYKFDSFQILLSTQWGGNYEPYDGDEDDAFAELTKEFTKQYALDEANKQYFEFNADGTAVWHLPTYISYSAAPASELRGTWDVTKSDDSVYISYSFTNGSSVISGEFDGDTIVRNMFLYSDFHHEARYQFSGQTEEGYSTDNNWQIQAVYKKTASSAD